ncbi:MAG: hypothetical protein Q9165_002697 [Trypethelium subeluteriae]
MNTDLSTNSNATAEVEEEIEVINAIYGGSTVTIVSAESIDRQVLINLQPILVDCVVSLPATYPFAPPCLKALPRYQYRDYSEGLVQQVLRDVWLEGQVCLFAFIEELRDTWATKYDKHETRPGKIPDVKEDGSELFPRETRPSEPKASRQVHYDEHGVDLNTVEDTAHDILGKTPQEICKDLEDDTGLRIVHCETIMRSDLRKRFERKQGELRQTLSNCSIANLKDGCSARGVYLREFHRARKEELVEYLVKPCVTFHGTQGHIVRSIVKYGFLIPGGPNPFTREAVFVQSGNTYGRGIYTSPKARVSSAYSSAECKMTKPSDIPGLKLIVCATLMGRSWQVTRADNWRLETQTKEGTDSCIANDNLEYVVFEPAQVLPCYVLHLDWGARHNMTKRLMELQSNLIGMPKPGAWAFKATNSEFAGDRQRNKEARKAAAAKWFPYGFGPATGSRFIIEDIGEVDDDEEEYGDYQEERRDGVQKVDIWEWDGETLGSTPYDQYTEERQAQWQVR